MKYADLGTKKDKIQLIRTMLGSNIAWASKGVTRIFENQTADEQNVEETVEHNGIGFTGADANILSSFAKQVLKGRTMSAKQEAILFKKMPKYAGQLERMTKAVVNHAVPTPYEDMSNEELLTVFKNLQASIQYYEAAEGNYSSETDARNEGYKQFKLAVTEAEKRGLL